MTAAWNEIIGFCIVSLYWIHKQTWLLCHSKLSHNWRIQTKENCEDTPYGSDIDLFTGIHHIVVTLGEQEDAQCVDCKIYKPLVLQEKTQHWKNKSKSSEDSFLASLLMNNEDLFKCLWQDSHSLS